MAAIDDSLSFAGLQVRAADVVAVSKLVCYCLTSTHFKDLLGSVEDFWRYEALQKVGCALSAACDHSIVTTCSSSSSCGRHAEPKIYSFLTHGTCMLWFVLPLRSPSCTT